MSLSRKISTYRDCADFLSKAAKGRVRARFRTKSQAVRFRQRCYQFRRLSGKYKDVVIGLDEESVFDSWCLIAGLPQPPEVEFEIEQLDRPAEPELEYSPPVLDINKKMTEQWIAGGCKEPGPGTAEWDAEFSRRVEQSFTPVVDPVKHVEKFGLEFDISDEDIS